MWKKLATKKFWVTALFLASVGAGASAAVAMPYNPTNPFNNYTCSSETNTCTCVGAKDCFKMGRSSDCGWGEGGPKDIDLSCIGGMICSCPWWGH